ncbi:hypothetical protein WUBG_08091 [Wuchereria bancrofti]|uniref:Uncharacterized protein n=1 Tax=Wuchereria bancrofti TaxID=6293 RepID=J9B242_WUCBA|nr:hypothetical protein WUBG_08091 [Wuchereria bancrofti]VDM08427.1 unnamed protein product [Wuchereria bancrofti]
MTPETLLTFLTSEVETECQAGLRRPYSRLKQKSDFTISKESNSSIRTKIIYKLIQCANLTMKQRIGTSLKIYNHMERPNDKIQTSQSDRRYWSERNSVGGGFVNVPKCISTGKNTMNDVRTTWRR